MACNAGTAAVQHETVTIQAKEIERLRAALENESEARAADEQRAAALAARLEAMTGHTVKRKAHQADEQTHQAMEEAGDISPPHDGNDSTSDANGETLWHRAGSVRRLTDHGRQVLADMVTAGTATMNIAARFKVHPQNVARLVRKNLMSGKQ